MQRMRLARKLLRPLRRGAWKRGDVTELDSRVLDWFHQGETGASSKCMAFHLTGRSCDGSYPHDSGDFKRCVGLLTAVPELRSLLPRMAEVNRYWAALVPTWEQIEALPSGERYAAIRQIIRPIEDADRGVLRLGDNATIRFGKIEP